MGTDVSTSAIQLGKALNDPIAGIGALSRVGVTFTAEQKNLIRTLVESGDVMSAQKIILAELNKEFGGSAKAAGDALTPLDDLRIKVDALKEAFGGQLLGFIDDFNAGLEEIGKWKTPSWMTTTLNVVDTVGSPVGSGANAVGSFGKKAAGAVTKLGQGARDFLGFAEGGTVPGPRGAPMLAMVHGGERVVSNRQQARGISEDQAPWVSPSGAKFIRFSAGKAYYADGRVYSAAGWNRVKSASQLKFNPNVKLDTSQIDDRRPTNTSTTPVARPGATTINMTVQGGGIPPEAALAQATREIAWAVQRAGARAV